MTAQQQSAVRAQVIVYQATATVITWLLVGRDPVVFVFGAAGLVLMLLTAEVLFSLKTNVREEL